MATNGDILLVSGDFPDLKSLSNLLINAGFHVHTIEDPQLAIDSALSEPPDLILFDFESTRMNGFEICKQLKNQGPTRDIPILFIIDLHDAKNKIRGFEAGGVDFISKPFEESEVLARVKTHLQLRKIQLHLDELVAERTAELNTAKQSLQESELRFRTTFEQAAVGIAHVLPDGRFVRINQRFCDIVGYSHSEMLELTFQDITHPNDLHADLENVEKLLSGEINNYSMEKRYLQKDGKIVWVNLTVSLLRDNAGEPKYFISVVEDITERKITEEQYYTFFVENISPVFWLEMKNPISIDQPVEKQVDAIFQEAHIKDVSELTAKMYGSTRSQLLGKKAINLYADEDYTGYDSQMHKYYQMFVRSGYIFDSIEILERLKEGVNLWLLINLKGIVEDRHLVRIWGSQIDITRRIEIESELRESERKFRNLIEQSPIVFELYDRNGVLRQVNSAFERLWLLSREDVLGKFNIFESEQVRELGFLPYFERAYAGEIVYIPDAEFDASLEEVAHGRSRKRWLSSIIYPVKELNGQVSHVAMLHEDITNRVQAEQQISEYQQRLKALSYQLTLSEERERQRIAVELHDNVGQSLAFARTRLAFAQKKCSDPEIQPILDEISESLLTSIQDTRNLVFDLSLPLLHEIGFREALAEWLEQQVQERYGLETKLNDQAPDIRLDDDLRAILFRNVRELLTNVVKHATASKVCVQLGQAGDRIVVTVQDDGIGFDPGAPTETVGRGEGFGLFSIQERMSDLGGDFKIESKLGQGTIASLSIPLNIQ